MATGPWSLLLILCLGTACGGRSGSPASSAAPTAAAPAAPIGLATTEAARAPALQALIDGARREGSLSFTWGVTTTGGPEDMAQLIAGFNRTYGLNLDVRFTPGPAMPEMGSKITQEYQAGRAASSDVMIGFGGHIMAMIQADALEPVDWATWAPNVQHPRSSAAGGRAVTFQTSPQGVTYNSNRLRPDEVPQTLQDLLKPQYKGRIASTPYASGFDRLPVPELWGEQPTLAFVTRFADQIGGLIRCNETQRIINGEFDLLALDCSPSNAREAKASGAPIDFAMVADAPLVQLLYMAVPRNAAHPNAAKLWINYMLSREAQDIQYRSRFVDSHLLAGSKTADELARLQAAGANIVEIDLSFYEQHDAQELARTLDEIVRVLQKQ